MVTARQWSLEAFETYLVRHPLMIHWVQRLLWIGHDKTGTAVYPFRLAEDGTYADQEEAEITLDGCAMVSLAHPIDLGVQQLQVWQQIWSDYELFPPFPQLTRRVYTPTDIESKTRRVERFKGIIVPGLSLLSLLEARGWEREENSHYCNAHTRVFAKSGLMARITYSGYIAVWNIRETEDLTLEACRFEAWPSVSDPEQNKQQKPIVLAEIEPRIFSEVLRDLAYVAAKQIIK